MKKIFVSLLLITVLMVPTAALAQDMEMNGDQPADSALSQNTQANQVVATVNGEEITSQQLAQQANVNQILQQVSQVDQQLAQLLASSEAGNTVLEELQKAKLDNLIDNVLLRQAAEESDITLSQAEKDEIYQQQKQSILQQNQMNEEQFQSILEQQGYENEAAYKEEFSNNPQIKINKLIEEEVVANIEISEEELQQAYDENEEAFAQSGQEDTSFESLKPQLEQMLRQQKQNQAIQEYLEQLREDAEIEKNI
ncbi:SurA-like protein [Halanaerobium saccharolyticum]|uniref:SurA-like protein n=1 Tax=Halanaerobium saccharolyticum TaxID=43595 RepID=A0A4R7ZB39_9FIRM|nr:SurA N-terminal domain-containing protein [Halanaerobium saccharolyticum]RAK09849.1 SurA-like protein [Halanaerobium saccharolyticum]TDW07411.1 SurA-like protein [Halanaerobium saccharolyticum]TDX61290.1 SurA-like protein [Halanaerobium saccharolyticum]